LRPETLETGTETRKNGSRDSSRDPDQVSKSPSLHVTDSDISTAAHFIKYQGMYEHISARISVQISNEK